MRLCEFIDPVACFYHGSTIPDLTKLKLRLSTLIGDAVVFAATMPEIAVAMSGHWTDDEFTFGHQTAAHDRDVRFPPYVMRELQPGRFRHYFRQRLYLYQVPAKYFSEDDALQDFEVISRTDVPVHTMITIADPLAYLQASPIIRVVAYNAAE